MPRPRPTDLPRLLRALDLDDELAAGEHPGFRPTGGGVSRDESGGGPAPARDPVGSGGPEAWLPRRADLVTSQGDRRVAVGGPDARRPLVQLPTGLVGARWRVRWRAVLGVAVALVVGAGIWAGRLALATRDAAPVPVDNTPVVARASATFAGPVASPSTTSGTLVVHVVGKVRHPGVVRLPVGARVVDAIRAAGGAGPGADLAALNLAQPLADGEQVKVPAHGETGVVSGGPAGASPAGSGGVGGVGGGLVDLNAADLTALDSLPGVGPVLGQRIIDWRTEHGRFTSVDDLGEVSGIGEKLLAQLRSKVRV